MKLSSAGNKALEFGICLEYSFGILKKLVFGFSYDAKNIMVNFEAFHLDNFIKHTPLVSEEFIV